MVQESGQAELVLSSGSHQATIHVSARATVLCQTQVPFQALVVIGKILFFFPPAVEITAAWLFQVSRRVSEFKV